jgi:hypothetical protein
MSDFPPAASSVRVFQGRLKTVFGYQEGAEVGYNPHKPGRPSHAYHTYWIARLRLCLDVEVRPLQEKIDLVPLEQWLLE